ncbi:MAG: hypothetical protein HC893_00675 [Chloroflexaceae bacterium]|nr:hypothetical protein [Chloroflexaceae bacterium]
MDEQIRDLIRQGVEALKAGDKATARRILLDVTNRAPAYQDAWLWLSDTTNSPVEQRGYIEQAISIDPYSRAGQIAQKS